MTTNGNTTQNGKANAMARGFPERKVVADIRQRLQKRLVSAINSGRVDGTDEGAVSQFLESKVQAVSSSLLHPDDVETGAAAISGVLDELFGYGPISELSLDMEISDILINGPYQVVVEKNGQLESTDVVFENEEHLLKLIKRLVATSGREIDEKTLPMVDVRLPDGSRLNAVINPVAMNGPLVSIRRFGARPLTMKDLLRNQTLTQEMADFLCGCVQARMNIIISGGTGSGKTTLLNALSSFIRNWERIVTIEDTAELELQQPHVVKMQARPASLDGAQEITLRDLVRNSLRMRPDRIIVGECRGSEALEMLQAMNTGHAGSLTTVHANSTRDAISRIELMIALGGTDVPLWAIRKQLAQSVNILIQVSRLVGGQRKVVRISEIAGIEQDTVTMHDLFEFATIMVDENQKTLGEFRSTGIRPECLRKLRISGIELSSSMFSGRTLRPQTIDENRQ